MSVPNGFDTLTSGLASIARLPFGTIVASPSLSTNVPRISAFYDMEGNTDCRLVRERISELDLNVDTVIPAGENSRAAKDASYKYYLGDAVNTIPRMVVVDESGERVYSGRDEVLGFLTDVFGARKPIMEENEDELKKKIVEALVLLGEPLPSLLRFGRAQDVAGCARSSETPRPSKPLIMYSYEGNQFCRLVREVLSELDIPYELKSAGKGSSKRAELSEITGGSTQCPFLIDPNTDSQMSESKDIIEYLYKNYATFTPPIEILGYLSSAVTPLKSVYKVLAPLQAGSGREDKSEYEAEIAAAKAEIEKEIVSDEVVIYTYSLSPFCTEALGVLSSLDIDYKEISLGLEWVPFLISDEGVQKRAALGEMTGQTSLPHVFVAGKSIGGLYEGLLPALEDGSFQSLFKEKAPIGKVVLEGSFE